MSSPFPVVRWRVKDLASCFFACRFPLEDERDVPAQMAHEGMILNSHRRRKGRRKKKMANEDGKSVESSSGNKRSGGVRAAKDGSAAVSDSSSWPRVSEEEYIVFCFKEDGAIHVINEGKPSELEAFNENKNDMKVGEKGSKEMESEQPPNEIKDTNPVEEPIAQKVDSFESCDSNLSDTSTSSFAFPVLSIEWIGSPVQMPKSDKNKARSVQLHCCRF